ncbi:hypothetical protein PROFUN_04512 [Planoprotostelium fungivorum]|uniref:Ankyrin repeat protein n=1 Tax=Planoprotostelium fungivorum TaxID=1890364 RepID=A0A2P6NBG3_9EUKA|nr:hypothetical protein PROFUN_04512 [Planoprotostelium fungivorum]
MNAFNALRLILAIGQRQWSHQKFNLAHARKDGAAAVGPPRVDPSVNNNEIIRKACAAGSTEIEKMLSAHPLVDPSTNANAQRRSAMRGRHAAVVELLLADSRVDPSANSNEASRCFIMGDKANRRTRADESLGTLDHPIQTSNSLRLEKL